MTAAKGVRPAGSQTGAEKRVTLLCHTDSFLLIEFEKGATPGLLLFFSFRVLFLELNGPPELFPPSVLHVSGG